jgi:anti-sigma factor RsiW
MLANILMGVAPRLVDMVTGAAKDKAIGMIAEKLGVEPNERAVEQHLTAHPEDAVKLEQIDADKVKLQLEEMQSARNMQLEAMKSQDPLVRRFVYFFIAFWSIWSAVMLPFMVFGEIPPENIRFADTILGFLLATMIGSMFGFLLGSSLGSKEKDQKK